MVGSKVHLFVFFNVYVDCKNTHGFSHNERESPKVEGPAVVVLVLLVLLFLITGISSITGDVNDDTNDVA